MNLYVFSLITGMMVLAGFVVAFAGYAVGGLLAWACRPVLPDGDSQIFRFMCLAHRGQTEECSPQSAYLAVVVCKQGAIPLLAEVWK